MSSTSRFNILKNTTNSITSNTSNTCNASNTTNSIKNNFNTNRFVSKHVNEERSKKQKEAEFIKSLDNLTAFPLLQKTTTITKTESNNNENNEKNQSITFIEAMKIKKKQIRSEKITTDDDVPPGCVCIKYDKISKKTVWIYGKNTTSSIANEKSGLEENEEPCVVFQRLVDLHQGRKYNHISKWGIDEYEKMFLYQNYDYDYFDNLDDHIQQDMEKYYQNNTYNLHNYNNDSDNDNY
jgi:hypothetical protein